MPNDGEIERRWRGIRRMNMKPSRLAKRIAAALADRLEAEGVTEAKLDQLGLN